MNVIGQSLILIDAEHPLVCTTEILRQEVEYGFLVGNREHGLGILVIDKPRYRLTGKLYRGVVPLSFREPTVAIEVCGYCPRKRAYEAHVA